MFKCFLFSFQKQKAGEEAKKQAEIDALQKQLQQLRDMNAGKAVSLNATITRILQIAQHCIILDYFGK